MPRTKLTGFARLLIFLLIALPIVYFAAAYYNGEDPVANVKQLLGLDRADRAADNTPGDVRLEELKAENARLRAALDRCEASTGS